MDSKLFYTFLSCTLLAATLLLPAKAIPIAHIGGWKGLDPHLGSKEPYVTPGGGGRPTLPTATPPGLNVSTPPPPYDRSRWGNEWG